VTVSFLFSPDEKSSVPSVSVTYEILPYFIAVVYLKTSGTFYVAFLHRDAHAVLHMQWWFLIPHHFLYKEKLSIDAQKAPKTDFIKLYALSGDGVIGDDACPVTLVPIH